MWDWLLFPKLNEKSSPRTLLILKNDDTDEDNDHRHHPPTATIGMIVTSWARGRRIRYVILALCSPLILPLLCATFPLICAVEICFRLCRRRCHRRRQSKAASPDDGGFDFDDMRRCEEGDVGEMRLLQRYLEDQLILVMESVYNCGELGFGDWDDYSEFFDTSCTSPLLCPD